MNFKSVLCGVSVLMTTLLIGCGGARHVAGGTSGTLHAGSVLLGDIQVTVHRVDGTTSEVVGMGITRHDGQFELVQPGAKGPLHLVPGAYRVTVESVGPMPLRFPKEYGSSDRTPLHVEWTAENAQLDLEVPLPIASR
jgi:hypothetical protein